MSLAKLKGVVATAAIYFSLTGTACDENVSVKGIVHDTAGAPLAEVAVTLQTEGRGPDRASTAKDGSFKVGIVGADPKRTRISFQKQGWKPFEQPVGKTARPVLDITLLPE